MVQFFLRSTVLANSVCETPCLNISLWNLQKESPCFLDIGNLLGTSKSVNSYLTFLLSLPYFLSKNISVVFFFFRLVCFFCVIYLFYLIIIFCFFVLKLLSANSFILSCIQGSLLIQLHSFKVHNIVLTRNYVQELIDSLVLKTSKLVFWCVFKDVPAGTKEIL